MHTATKMKILYRRKMKCKRISYGRQQQFAIVGSKRTRAVFTIPCGTRPHTCSTPCQDNWCNLDEFLTSLISSTTINSYPLELIQCIRFMFMCRSMMSAVYALQFCRFNGDRQISSFKVMGNGWVDTWIFFSDSGGRPRTPESYTAHNHQPKNYMFVRFRVHCEYWWLLSMPSSSSPQYERRRIRHSVWSDDGVTCSMCTVLCANNGRGCADCNAIMWTYVKS